MSFPDRKDLKQLRPVAFLLRHRVWSSILAVVLVIAIAWTVLAQFASWSLVRLCTNVFTDSHSIWFVTDKQRVNAVDCIVLERENTSLEIKNESLKKVLIRNADFSDSNDITCFHCFGFMTFYLYQGDEVVRTLFVTFSAHEPAKLFVGKQTAPNSEENCLGYVKFTKREHQRILRTFSELQKHEQSAMKEVIQ